jgi:hypothetical protein
MLRVEPFGTGGGELLAGEQATSTSFGGGRGRSARDPARDSDARRQAVQRVCSLSARPLGTGHPVDSRGGGFCKMTSTPTGLTDALYMP